MKKALKVLIASMFFTAFYDSEGMFKIFAKKTPKAVSGQGESPGDGQKTYKSPEVDGILETDTNNEIVLQIKEVEKKIETANIKIKEIYQTIYMPNMPDQYKYNKFSLDFWNPFSEKRIYKETTKFQTELYNFNNNFGKNAVECILKCIFKKQVKQEDVNEFINQYRKNEDGLRDLLKDSKDPSAVGLLIFLNYKNTDIIKKAEDITDKLREQNAKLTALESNKDNYYAEDYKLRQALITFSAEVIAYIQTSLVGYDDEYAKYYDQLNALMRAIVLQLEGNNMAIEFLNEVDQSNFFIVRIQARNKVLEECKDELDILMNFIAKYFNVEKTLLDMYCGLKCAKSVVCINSVNNLATFYEYMMLIPLLDKLVGIVDRISINKFENKEEALDKFTKESKKFLRLFNNIVRFNQYVPYMQNLILLLGDKTDITNNCKSSKQLQEKLENYIDKFSNSEVSEHESLSNLYSEIHKISQCFLDLLKEFGASEKNDSKGRLSKNKTEECDSSEEWDDLNRSIMVQYEEEQKYITPYQPIGEFVQYIYKNDNNNDSCRKDYAKSENLIKIREKAKKHLFKAASTFLKEQEETYPGLPNLILIDGKQYYMSYAIPEGWEVKAIFPTGAIYKTDQQNYTFTKPKKGTKLESFVFECEYGKIFKSKYYLPTVIPVEEKPGDIIAQKMQDLKQKNEEIQKLEKEIICLQRRLVENRSKIISKIGHSQGEQTDAAIGQIKGRATQIVGDEVAFANAKADISENGKDKLIAQYREKEARKELDKLNKCGFEELNQKRKELRREKKELERLSKEIDLKNLCVSSKKQYEPITPGQFIQITGEDKFHERYITEPILQYSSINNCLKKLGNSNDKGLGSLIEQAKKDTESFVNGKKTTTNAVNVTIQSTDQISATGIAGGYDLRKLGNFHVLQYIPNGYSISRYALPIGILNLEGNKIVLWLFIVDDISRKVPSKAIFSMIHQREYPKKQRLVEENVRKEEELLKQERELMINIAKYQEILSNFSKLNQLKGDISNMVETVLNDGILHKIGNIVKNKTCHDIVEMYLNGIIEKGNNDIKSLQEVRDKIEAFYKGNGENCMVVAKDIPEKFQPIKLNNIEKKTLEMMGKSIKQASKVATGVMKVAKNLSMKVSGKRDDGNNGDSDTEQKAMISATMSLLPKKAPSRKMMITNPEIPRGIINNCNFCYINAVMQLLFTCPEISKMSLTLGRAYNKYIQSQGAADLEEFHQELKAVCSSDFIDDGNSQQDASLFLRGLISELKSKVMDYSFKEKKIFTCGKGHSSEISKDEYVLTLHIKSKGENLESMILDDLKQEKNFMHKCQTSLCNETMCTLDKLIIPSDILFIQVMRFNNSQQCVNTNINIPPTVTINKQNYAVVGIVNHFGNSLENGHYTAIVKRGEKWYSCDDHRISSLNNIFLQDGILAKPLYNDQGHAYIIMLKKII